MSIPDIVKQTIEDHKQEVTYFQWAVMSGISSLIYSEYISKFKRKFTPVERMLVPKISYVSDFLNPDKPFIKYLSEHLIDEMVEDPHMKPYISQLSLFQPDKIEVLKMILDGYVIPNVYRRIPETISIKFGLNNEDQHFVVEDWEIDIFPEAQLLNGKYVFLHNYVVSEIVLQLLLYTPEIPKEISIPESNNSVSVDKDQIITIENETAICPVHLSYNQVIRDLTVMDLLQFVTSSTLYYTSDSMLLTTSPFNKVSFTRLK